MGLIYLYHATDHSENTNMVAERTPWWWHLSCAETNWIFAKEWVTYFVHGKVELLIGPAFWEKLPTLHVVCPQGSFTLLKVYSEICRNCYISPISCLLFTSVSLLTLCDARSWKSVVGLIWIIIVNVWLVICMYTFQVSLHSMHKYLPRVHILQTTDLQTPPEQQASVDRAVTYSFAETTFTTVTAYQNQQVSIISTLRKFSNKRRLSMISQCFIILFS